MAAAGPTSLTRSPVTRASALLLVYLSRLASPRPVCETIFAWWQSLDL